MLTNSKIIRDFYSIWTQIYPKCGPLGVPIHDFGVLSALVHSKCPLEGGFDEI